VVQFRIPRWRGSTRPHDDVGIVDENPEEVGRRRREAAIAGHIGDADAARALVDDPAAPVRATALGALARLGALDRAMLVAALHDEDPGVRRRAATEASRLPGLDVGAELRAALGDPDPLVAEAAAWSLGERDDHDAVPVLATTATTHDDALVREAAVAALGAIGDERGLPAILAATTDKPAVRRRAVLALAPFEGEDVETALHRALEDRDWQVRQAAEDLLD
jgi:HEAT repeat protein